MKGARLFLTHMPCRRSLPAGVFTMPILPEILLVPLSRPRRLLRTLTGVLVGSALMAACSLDQDSWPIEVGLSRIDHNLQVQTYHSLIQPVPEWPEHAWSPASAVVHNIPRRVLDTAPDVTESSRRICSRPWAAASRYPTRPGSSVTGLIDCLLPLASRITSQSRTSTQ